VLRCGLPLQRQLDQGLEPRGYRAEWLRAGAKVIVMLAVQHGDALGAEHPEDAVSLADLLNLLASARGMLIAKCGAEHAVGQGGGAAPGPPPAGREY